MSLDRFSRPGSSAPALAVLFTVLTRWVLQRFHMNLDLPEVLAYPSLAAFFTLFALWLIFSFTKVGKEQGL